MITINRTFLHALYFLFTLTAMIACKNPEPVLEKEPIIREELEKINTLLRDPGFAEEVAKHLDSFYYAGIGQTQPVFIAPGDDTTKIFKSVKSEKIATNLAGFYALECGIGLLIAQSGGTPVEWLSKITGKNVDPGSMRLLNRFANATWKASQPFRDLNRITRPNFIIASSLSKEEVDKDSMQIFHAAEKLLASMSSARDSSVEIQMKLLHALLRDTVFAVEMAEHLHASYNSGSAQREPLFLPGDDTATVVKTAKQMKIATSVAGFYALECGLNYLVTIGNERASAILESLVNDSLEMDDKMLFARFANATWKAGQPFRDLSRITRDTFTPFYFLTKQDIDKDLVQIKAAAAFLLDRIK